MVAATRSRRVAEAHQFLILDRRANQYVFHDGAAIVARPIHPPTLSRVLDFYQDYLGWPVYDLSDTEDTMPATPLYQNPEWATVLAAINHDPTTKIHASTLNALLKRGFVHVLPRGGLGLTPDGEAWLEASATAPQPEMLRSPALDADAPPDFAGAPQENGHSQAAIIRAGVDEAVREHANGNGSRAASVIRAMAVRAQDQIEQHIAAQPQPVEPAAPRFDELVTRYPHAVAVLRTALFDVVERQVESHLPDLLPAIRALRATE